MPIQRTLQTMKYPYWKFAMRFYLCSLLVTSKKIEVSHTTIQFEFLSVPSGSITLDFAAANVFVGTEHKSQQLCFQLRFNIKHCSINHVCNAYEHQAR